MCIRDSYEGSSDSKAKLNGADIFVSSIHDVSKATLATGLPAKGNFNEESIRLACYRPFTKTNLYFNKNLNERKKKIWNYNYWR